MALHVPERTWALPAHSVDLDRYQSNSTSDDESKKESYSIIERYTTSDSIDVPPMDGGFHAWMFLLASAMLEALLTFGLRYAFAFGVFQEYYSATPPFKGSENIAVIGTCAMGLAYMLAPFAIVFMILVPRFARWVSTVGVILMCLSLAISSFATNVTHLMLTQGIGFGVGGCLAYTPSILYMSEWFCKRKGLAFGVVWAGSAISGSVFPITIEWLLNKYGVESTLRVSSVALCLLAAPFLYFHHPRLPPAKTASHERLNFRFLVSKVHLVYQLGNTIEALGFFLPTIYLPMCARSLGASKFLSSFTVTLFNLAAVFSNVLIGFLSDRYHVTICILISTVGTVLSVFFLWGFSTSLPILYVFCAFYGLMADGYSSTWAGITHEIQLANPGSDPAVIFPIHGAGPGNRERGEWSAK
ncbi:hypothetical protein N7470_007018 [Penicillium chermesinum]|nr:hypothetical protein N7470_007018 [Penicillium chermesinum]